MIRQSRSDVGNRMSKDRKQGYEESPCVASAMRKASRRLTQLYDRAMEPWGLRSTQFAILHEIARRAKEPATIAQLAKALVMDRSALGHNLRPLERDGYVVLRGGVGDRRRRFVFLTPRGKAKLQAGERYWEAAQERFRQAFGKAEADRLRATLLEIARDLKLGTFKE
jgi:DNA-binding MarR family transcriptional regulator